MKHKYYQKRIFSIPWKQFKSLFGRKYNIPKHDPYPTMGVCQVLLKNRIHGDERTRKALHKYLQTTHPPSPSPTNESPLDTAIYFNFPLCFKYLVDSGCPYDPRHVQTMLYQVTLYCQWGIMTTMIRTNMVYPRDVQVILDDDSIGLNRRYVLWRNFQYWVQDQVHILKELGLRNHLIPRIMEYMGSGVGKNTAYCSCVVLSAKSLIKK